MHTLAVLAQKGGVGKSMIARSLAIAALLDGRKAAIVDADPQGTVTAWGKRREHAAPTVFPVGELAVGKAVAEAKRRGAGFVVIDTPPSIQPLINGAATAADTCLIVTGIFPEDIETVANVVQIVRALKKPCAILVNKTTRSHALTLARAALATFRLPVCPATISQLVSHPYASAEGLTASEREPGGKAALEIDAAWRWLRKEGIV
jgi:chromosome partitioning protein